jgi:hypothetical protein
MWHEFWTEFDVSGKYWTAMGFGLGLLFAALLSAIIE